MIDSGVERQYRLTGVENNQTSMEGSSRESWSMGESLNQRRQRPMTASVVKVRTSRGE